MNFVLPRRPCSQTTDPDRMIPLTASPFRPAPRGRNQGPPHPECAPGPCGLVRHPGRHHPPWWPCEGGRHGGASPDGRFRPALPAALGGRAARLWLGARAGPHVGPRALRPGAAAGFPESRPGKAHQGRFVFPGLMLADYPHLDRALHPPGSERPWLWHSVLPRSMDHLSLFMEGSAFRHPDARTLAYPGRHRGPAWASGIIGPSAASSADWQHGVNDPDAISWNWTARSTSPRLAILTVLASANAVEVSGAGDTPQQGNRQPCHQAGDGGPGVLKASRGKVPVNFRSRKRAEALAATGSN